MSQDKRFGGTTGSAASIAVTCRMIFRRSKGYGTSVRVFASRIDLLIDIPKEETKTTGVVRAARLTPLPRRRVTFSNDCHTWSLFTCTVPFGPPLFRVPLVALG